MKNIFNTIEQQWEKSRHKKRIKRILLVIAVVTSINVSIEFKVDPIKVGRFTIEPSIELSLPFLGD